MKTDRGKSSAHVTRHQDRPWDTGDGMINCTVFEGRIKVPVKGWFIIQSAVLAGRQEHEVLAELMREMFYQYDSVMSSLNRATA
jgi:hypothetical protein